MALHFILTGDLCAIENVLQVIKEAAKFSGFGRVKMWCGPVATHGHRGMCGGCCCVIADVEAIFTWFTGGDSVDDKLDNRFCTELLNNVSVISDDV